MTIRYAKEDDCLWLKKHDSHISERKIENKEVYAVEEDGEIIGWLRYSLFWDSVP
jgi:hypothetical protein